MFKNIGHNAKNLTGDLNICMIMILKSHILLFEMYAKVATDETT